MLRNVLMVISALVVSKSVSVKMMLYVMLNPALVNVNPVGMEHTVRSHVPTVTGVHHVAKYVTVLRMALYVIRKMGSVSVVQVTLANNAMNSVQRVRTVNNAPNCVSVVKEVMDAILSPVDVSVSLAIMVQCVIKVSKADNTKYTDYLQNVRPENGVKIVKNIVTVEMGAPVISPLVFVGVRPIGLVKSVNFHVRM